MSIAETIDVTALAGRIKRWGREIAR